MTDDYRSAGYLFRPNLVPVEVAAALLDQFWRELHGGGLPFAVQSNPVLPNPALELHGANFPAITAFLWGLTPTAASVCGCDLLPAYAFFRLYRKGDRLRVHHDRAACEHSLSLTLGYSDDLPWPFDIGRTAADGRPPAEDFGDEPHSTIAMQPGDGLFYRGMDRRHGRVLPNPNQWSAHLFLHWVERDGRHRDQAFEGIGN